MNCTGNNQKLLIIGITAVFYHAFKNITAEIAGMCLFTVYQSLIKNGASSGRGSTTPPASLYSNEKVTVTSPLPSASSQPDRSSILPSLV